MNNFPAPLPEESGLCLLAENGTVLHMDQRFARMLGFSAPQTGIPVSTLLPMFPNPCCPLHGWLWIVKTVQRDEPESMYIRCRAPQESDSRGVQLSQRPASTLHCATEFSWFFTWMQQNATMIHRDISHRFGNAMSSIMGFADILRQRGAGIDDPFALRALNNIFRGCEQMRDIIGDVQILTARAPVALQRIDFGSWLKQNCTELALLKPHSFFLQPPQLPAEALYIQADTAQLRNLFLDIWELAQRASEQQNTPGQEPHVALSLEAVNPARMLGENMAPANGTGTGMSVASAPVPRYARLRLTLQHTTLKDFAVAHQIGSIPPPEGDSPLPYGFTRIRGTALLHGGFHEILSAPGMGCIVDVYLPACPGV